MDPDSACHRCDVHPRTLERWLAAGYDAATLEAEGYELDPTRAAHRRFLSDFHHACEELHEKLLDRIHDGLDDMNPLDALKLLERLKRRRWGRVDTLRVEGADAGNRLPFTERYADTLAELLRGIIADLRLTPEQAKRVPEILERNLGRVSAREEVQA